MRTRHSAFAALLHTPGLSQHDLSLKGYALKAVRQAQVVLAGNFGRLLGVTLIVSLLATSTPTAAPTLVNFAKEAERITVSRSHDSMFFSVLRRGLGYGSHHYWSLSNKLASKATPRHDKGASYAPVAAVISPAPVVIDAPTNLTVTATANTSISLSWTAPAGTVDSYQVERSQSASGPFSVIGTPTATNFNDTTVSSGSAYLYRVRAVAGGIPSSPSNMAVGTAITYTDNPLSAGVTVVKAVHVTELRQSVNAVRSVAGLSAASWTDTSLSGIFVKAVHVQEMRDKLAEALTALSVPITAYTDPVLTVGTTLVKKVHIEELRQRASRSSSTSSGGIGGDLSTARLDPLNRTGSGGEDPLSRNFNWTIPLVNLSGRAVLNLGLSLSYNSLVWTRSGSFISFDDDRGFPSPGFRLGFPVIQPLYFNSETGKWSYLLITPTGSRVELRQVGTSALYESADSAHMLLDTSTNPMILRITDGTQLSYQLKGSDFQCTQIKDRNGNFITVNYTAFNRIDTVIDTLSRSIKFNYDGSQSLTSITQTWTVNGSPVTHTWASFTYSSPNLTIQTNFPGLTVIGPANGSTIKVLSQVSVNDGSRFNFDYTSWGQVWKISNFAAAPNDQHLRNYRSYNLPQNNSTAHSDCPRFTERRDFAANWNRSGPNGAANLPVGAEQEVVTTYAVPTSATWTMPDNSQQTGMRAQITFPDNTYNKLYFEGTAGTSSGWKRELISLVETFDSINVRQKQSVTTWTQDNTALSFPLNPRATETNAYDPAGNRARTVITYQTANLPDGTSCRLPQDVLEYQANATTVLRRTHTEYNLNSTYTNRRIIGLVSEKTVYQVDPITLAETLMSKFVFEYDETGSIQGNDAPVQHDNTNYTSNFVAGRGNLSSVKRFDVITPSQFVTSTNRYNTAGATVQITDPSNHSVTISYTDAFAANGTTLDPPLGFSTLAYPTTMTDADGYSSSIRYNYDFGAPTWNQKPLPNTTVNTPGPQDKMTYDSFGRIERITNLVNNAYTRFIYGPNYVESFASVNNVADEAHLLEVFDGAGQTIAKASNHPGSVGGFSGQLFLYDVMGRSSKQSNPTETSITISGVLQPYNWTATGDDAAGGWVYRQQTYDWNGRPILTTNPDGTTKETSYGGCGCAGGQIVTMTDEGTIVGGVTKKRQKKLYSDVLGRTIKVEVLNWDGAGPFGTNGTVYSATVNTYNARDQLTSVKQYAGAATVDGSCPTGTCQETTSTYDGHGRLMTQHVPEQNAGTHTLSEYNSDDTILKITDARGASATYTHNGRHLVTAVTYNAPAGVTATPNVSFGYDAAQNRTSMTDGLGSKSYTYDQLSQLISETRTFSSGTFTLTYDYNLAGDVKKITDPTNMTINYGYDSIGRLISVTGSDNLFMGISTYASNFQYRAWGGLKASTDGANRISSWTYNSKLQPAHFEISGNAVSQNYTYFNDGNVKFVQHTTDSNFDRLYSYDHASRMTLATTGGAARGDSGSVPYHETFNYDAFSNLIARQSSTWSEEILFDDATYSNNRRQGWGYDADGRNTTIGTRTYNYDADGEMRLMTGQKWLINHYINVSHARGYDGDGEMGQETLNSQTTYYLRSSVLDDQITTEINSSGQKTVGFVYSPDGELLARQVPAGSSSYIGWKRRTPDGTGQHDFNVGGAFGTGVPQRVELDPLGADIGLDAPQVSDLGGGGQGDIGTNHSGGITDSRWSTFFDLSSGCTKEGVAASCSQGMTSRNFDAEMRAFFGDAWYDLPGNNNERERSEEIYVKMVQKTLEERNKNQKPKLKKGKRRKRPMTPEERRKAEERRKRDAKKGNNEDEVKVETHGLPVFMAQKDKRGGSYLNSCALHVFKELGFGRFINLNDVRIHVGLPLGVERFAAIPVQAVTIGHDIYYKSIKDYNPVDVEGLADLGHELVHVAQQAAMGVDPFLVKYFAEYGANRIKGMSPEEAYENISFEVFAYKIQEMLKTRIKQQFGDDPCKKFRF